MKSAGLPIITRRNRRIPQSSDPGEPHSYRIELVSCRPLRHRRRTAAEFVATLDRHAFAMEISGEIGGVPDLTAVFVVLTGIIGATLGEVVLAGLPLRSKMARELACSWCWSDVAVAPLIVNLMNRGRSCQINILPVNASVSLFLLLHRAGRSFAAVHFDLPRKGAAMYHSQELIARGRTGALVDRQLLHERGSHPS